MSTRKRIRIITLTLLTLLTFAGVMLAASYHVMWRGGDEKLLVVWPKDEMGFERTWVDMTEWGLTDLVQNRDLVGKAGTALLAVMKMRITGKTAKRKEIDVTLGELEQDGIYCSWGEEWLVCLKR